MTEMDFVLHRMVQIVNMSILDIIYYCIMSFNLIVSIVLKRLWKQYFWLYFAVTIFIEGLVSCKIPFITMRVYNFLDIFCIVYFGWLYGRELRDWKLIKVFALFFVLSGIIFIFFSNTNYSTVTGFLYSIFLIFISLLWCYRKVSEKESKDNIINLAFFWISSALLIWAVFYIFRMFPMYLFVKSDLVFSYFIKTLFQIITILSYILFLKGLLCKK